MLDNLYRAIEVALNEVAPLEPKRLRSKSTWWNSEFEATRRTIRNLVKKHKSRSEIEQLAQLKIEYKNNITKAKIASFRSYCNKATTHSGQLI